MPTSEPRKVRREDRRWLSSPAVKLFFVVGFLYCFLVGLDLMGIAFKYFGGGFAQELLIRTANPFVGLLAGVLATSLVQSSSTTSSITVGLVAGGALSIEGAIPVIMGANIGTSVTNTIVSLGHVTRPEEFRRAFSGATLHDVFNWLTVLLLLPLELGFGYLSKTASVIATGLRSVGGIDMFNPVKAAVRPAAELLGRLAGESGAISLLLGVALLFVGLKFLVDFLKAVFTSRAEQILHGTLFRSPMAAIAAGCAITVMVQSSSISTSAMVPLVGAGIVTLEQLFPFTVGANLGTTVTALLAALVTGSEAAVAVALSHLLFNVNGAIVVFGVPFIRAIPLAVARKLGDLAHRSRVLALAYVAVLFFGLPLALLLISGALDRPVDRTGAAASPTITVQEHRHV